MEGGCGCSEQELRVLTNRMLILWPPPAASPTNPEDEAVLGIPNHGNPNKPLGALGRLLPALYLYPSTVTSKLPVSKSPPLTRKEIDPWVERSLKRWGLPRNLPATELPAMLLTHSVREAPFLLV